MLIYFLLVVALPLTTSREPHLANQIDGKLSTAAWGAPEGSDGDPDVLEPSDPQDEAEQTIDKDSVDSVDVAAELASTDEAATEMLGESSVVEDDAEALPAGLAPSMDVSPSPFPEDNETVEAGSTNESTDTEAERSEAITEEDGTNEEEVEGREPESEDEGEPRAADGASEEENAEDGTFSPDEDDVDVDESEELKKENDATELATERSDGSEDDVDAEEVPGEAAVDEDEAGGSGEDETDTSEGMDGDVDEAEFPSVEESDGELPARERDGVADEGTPELLGDVTDDQNESDEGLESVDHMTRESEDEDEDEAEAVDDEHRTEESPSLGDGSPPSPESLYETSDSDLAHRDTEVSIPDFDDDGEMFDPLPTGHERADPGKPEFASKARAGGTWPLPRDRPVGTADSGAEWQPDLPDIPDFSSDFFPAGDANDDLPRETMNGDAAVETPPPQVSTEPPNDGDTNASRSGRGEGSDGRSDEKADDSDEPEGREGGVSSADEEDDDEDASTTREESIQNSEPTTPIPTGRTLRGIRPVKAAHNAELERSGGAHHVQHSAFAFSSHGWSSGGSPHAPVLPPMLPGQIDGAPKFVYTSPSMDERRQSTEVKILADTIHVELLQHAGASIVGRDITGRSVVIYYPTDDAAQEGFRLLSSRIRNTEIYRE
ncbi:hypothetical protein FOZ61_004020 [Perkinsus olseni]|nr:hypothetical protein FOZ61_004020 [Perkinsus olseni]